MKFLIFLICLSLFHVWSSPRLFSKESSLPKHLYVVKIVIFVNQMKIGSVWATPHIKKDKFKISLSELSKVLYPYLSSEYFIGEKLKMKSEEGDSISLHKLEEFAFKMSYDSNKLALTFYFSPEMMKKQEISLKEEESEESKFIFENDRYSGYLNSTVTETYHLLRDESHFELGTLSGNFHLVQYVSGLVVETGVDYSKEMATKDKIHLVRNDTRLIKDFPSASIRGEVGDIEYQIVGYQTKVALGGIAFFREYSISPKSFNQSIDKTTIILKRPSKLEVYLNDSLISKLYLKSGPVNLSNYPFTLGENKVMLKIEDDLGKVEVVNFTHYYHSDFPRLNKIDYNVAFGFPSTVKGFNRVYDQQDPTLSTFLRKSYSDYLSFEGSFASDPYVSLIGFSTQAISPLGFTKINIANSYFFSNKLARSVERASSNSTNSGYPLEGKGTLKGFAFRIEHETLDSNQGENHPIIYRLSADARSDHFMQVDSSPSLERLRNSVSASKFLGEGLSGGLGLAALFKRESKRTFELKLDLFKNYLNGIQLNLNFFQEISKSDNSTKEKRVEITLTWNEKGGKTQSYLYYNTESKSANSLLQYKAIQNGEHQLDLSAGASVSPQIDNVSGEMDYASSLGEARIEHQIAYYNKGNTFTSTLPQSLSRESSSNRQRKFDQNGSLNVRTGVGWTKDLIAFGPPINDSFALIHLSTKNRAKIPIQMESSRPLGTLKNNSTILLTTLQPYYNEEVYLETSKLPIYLKLDRDRFQIKTKYKSGASIHLKLSENYPILFYIKKENGTPLSFVSGELRSKSQKESIHPFFSNSKGRVFIDSIDLDDYEISFNSNQYTPLNSPLLKIESNSKGYKVLDDIIVKDLKN